MPLRDPQRLTPSETRACVVKLNDILQGSGYFGDVRLKYRGGQLVHVDLEQSALPRDILEDRFICALVRRGKHGQDSSH